MHEFIVSPCMGDYLVLHPGFPKGVKIPHRRYREFAQVAEENEICPSWFAAAVHQTWALKISGRLLNELVIIRRQTLYEYGRASYELNLGCNYACKHCYLGLKEFAGLPWSERERLAPVLVELVPPRPVESADEIVIIDDLDEMVDAAMVMGCGDDNPYR